MPSPKRRLKRAGTICRLFTGPGHPVRAAILTCILDQIGEVRLIAREMSISQPLVVHHLSIMKTSGWVTKMKIGRTTIYSIKPEILESLKKFTETLRQNL